MNLVELLLVLGVVALLLLAAFVVYPKVRDRSQINEAATTLMAAKAKINTLYLTNKLRGLNNQVVKNAKIFPSTMYPDPYPLAYTHGMDWFQSPHFPVNIME